MTELTTIDETRTDIVPGQVGFNSAQKAMLAQLGLSDAPEGDLILFSHVCQKSGLDPFRKEIYMIGRNTQVTRYVPNSGSEGQHKETRYETVYTIQTGIQGFRKRSREIAEGKGIRLGFNGPYWCGEDMEWREVWPGKEKPVAAKYVVFRDGEPVPAVCHFDEYVQTVKVDGQQVPNSMWSTMPRNQIAKCAEALALQRAFPDELSGLLLEDAAVHTVINEDGDEQPAEKRRGGKGVNGLADRAAAKMDLTDAKRVVEGEVVPPGQGGGNDQSQRAEPSSGAELPSDSGDQAHNRSVMRKPLEKRLFNLIGAISPQPSREDRLDIYRYLLNRDDIQSTDDLNDFEVAKVGDSLFRLNKDGILDKTVRDIVMAADAKAAENQTGTTETDTQS